MCGRIEASQCGVQPIGRGALHDIMVRAEVEKLDDFQVIVGSAEDDHRQLCRMIPAANPSEHFLSGNSGQVQIQQHELGKRMQLAVGINARAAEIFDGPLAILHYVEGTGGSPPFEQRVKEEHVVRTVFNEKNRADLHAVLSCVPAVALDRNRAQIRHPYRIKQPD